MARDFTLVPTRLMVWPRVRKLDSEQRLLLMYLWSTQDMSSVGVANIRYSAWSEEIACTKNSIEGILEYLEFQGLVSVDKETDEVFLLDWFRVHTFKGVGKNIAANEMKKITSIRILDSVKKAIISNERCGLAIENPIKNEQSTSYLANNNINNNINNNTTTTVVEGESSAVSSFSGGCDFSLLEFDGDAELAKMAAEALPLEKAQQVLDELVGRIEAGKKGVLTEVLSPGSVLRKFIKSVKDRSFTFERGAVVAKKREAAKRNAAKVASAWQQQPPEPIPAPTNTNSADEKAEKAIRRADAQKNLGEIATAKKQAESIKALAAESKVAAKWVSENSQFFEPENPQKNQQNDAFLWQEGGDHLAECIEKEQ